MKDSNPAEPSVDFDQHAGSTKRAKVLDDDSRQGVMDVPIPTQGSSQTVGVGDEFARMHLKVGVGKPRSRVDA